MTHTTAITNDVLAIVIPACSDYPNHPNGVDLDEDFRIASIIRSLIPPFQREGFEVRLKRAIRCPRNNEYVIPLTPVDSGAIETEFRAAETVIQIGSASSDPVRWVREQQQIPGVSTPTIRSRLSAAERLSQACESVGTKLQIRKQDSEILSLDVSPSSKGEYTEARSSLTHITAGSQTEVTIDNVTVFLRDDCALLNDVDFVWSRDPAVMTMLRKTGGGTYAVRNSTKRLHGLELLFPVIASSDSQEPLPFDDEQDPEEQTDVEQTGDAT